MHHCGRCRVPATRRAFWRTKLQRNKARDARVNRALRQAGWRVLTVWECQTRNPARLAQRIQRFLNPDP